MLQPQKRTPPRANLDHSDNFEPALLTLSRTNARLAGQFLALQTRTAKLVLTELTQRQREFGKTINSFALLIAKPFSQPHQALEMQKIVQNWCDLLWLTQNAFSQTWLDSTVPEQQSVDSKPLPDPERRVSAQVIRFPDRRARRSMER